MFPVVAFSFWCSQYCQILGDRMFFGPQNDLHTDKCDWLPDWLGVPLAPCWSQSSPKVTNKKIYCPHNGHTTEEIKALRGEDDPSQSNRWFHFILQSTVFICNKHLDLFLILSEVTCFKCFYFDPSRCHVMYKGSAVRAMMMQLRFRQDKKHNTN